VDDNTVRLENAPFVEGDLGLHAFVIAATRVGLPELRRSEKATVLHAIERRPGEEIERAGSAEIDAVVLEARAIEIAAVDGDRFGAELVRQAREPGLEESGALARRRRPARVRSRRDVENALVPHARQRSERALQALDEHLEYRFELGLGRHLARERVPVIEARVGEQRALRRSSRQRCETVENRVLHYRESMPSSRVNQPTHEELLGIYAQPKTIAVVGASNAVGKAAHDIPSYLQSQGYRIVPVNPRGGEILGERAFATLRDVNVPVDVVNVFRPQGEADATARDAVAIGAKVLWFQLGTDTDAAAAVAAEAGMTVVRRRCMGVTHGLLGLGPGPHPRA